MIILSLFHFGNDVYEGGGKSFLEIAAPVISAVASVCTLYITFKLYRNLDAKKLFIKNQVENVIELAKIIEGMYIAVDRYKGFISVDPRMVDLPNLKRVIKHIKKTDKKVGEKDLYFVKDVIPKLTFLSYIENIFIPLTIKKELQKFQAVRPVKYYTDTFEYYVVNVHLKIYSHIERFKPEKDYCLYEESTYNNVLSFLNQILNLRTAIHKWLKEYGIDGIEFLPDNNEPVEDYYRYDSIPDEDFPRAEKPTE